MQKVVDAWNKEQGAKQSLSVKMILLSRDNTFSRETARSAPNRPTWIYISSPAIT